MEESKVDEAASYFMRNCNCCQSIILTYGPQFGLPKEVGFRLGTGFVGGPARHGEVCGAVSGAIMVIGLAHGMIDESDIKASGKTYELVNQFIKRFLKKNCFIKCRELLGCDIGTPEGMAFAKDQGLFETLCSNFVHDAAEILEQLICNK